MKDFRVKLCHVWWRKTWRYFGAAEASLEIVICWRDVVLWSLLLNLPFDLSTTAWKSYFHLIQLTMTRQKNCVTCGYFKRVLLIGCRSSVMSEIRKTTMLAKNTVKEAIFMWFCLFCIVIAVVSLRKVFCPLRAIRKPSSLIPWKVDVFMGKIIFNLFMLWFRPTDRPILATSTLLDTFICFASEDTWAG